MSRLFATLALSLLIAAPVFADNLGEQTDQAALRKLKVELAAATNSRDYAALQKLLHQPFMTTLVTQDNFTEMDKLKAYFENLYTRDTLRMKTVSIAAEPDGLSQIYQGTFAVNKGSTKEHYEMADGRSFDMNGRWTAVSIKDNGEWKLLAIHTGTNFLDNPVLSAIEKSVVWVGVAGAAGGLMLGFVAGWFVRKSRAGKSAA